MCWWYLINLGVVLNLQNKYWKSSLIFLLDIFPNQPSTAFWWYVSIIYIVSYLFIFYIFFKNDVLLICVFLQILSKFAISLIRYQWVVKNNKSKDKLIIKNIILVSVYVTVVLTYYLMDSIPYYSCRFKKEHL